MFLRDTGIFRVCFFYFGIWDIQEFWDMGYFGRFILGYGILHTPLTKPLLLVSRFSSFCGTF